MIETARDKDERKRIELTSEEREIIDELTPFDSIFFDVFFSGPQLIPLVERMIRAALGREDICVREANVEQNIKNLFSRSIRLDIWAVDETGSLYDVELQADPAGASPQRARYYSSVIDANFGPVGVSTHDIPERLPSTHVIFFTLTDVLGAGEAIYHIDRTVRETGAEFLDGSHIIYVNCAREDATTEIGRIVHDLKCTMNGEMLTREFAERRGYMTEEEKEVEQIVGERLQKRIDDERIKGEAEGWAKGRAEGRAEGMIEGAMKVVVDMVRSGVISNKDAAANLSMSEAVFAQKMNEYLNARV